MGILKMKSIAVAQPIPANKSVNTATKLAEKANSKCMSSITVGNPNALKNVYSATKTAIV